MSRRIDLFPRERDGTRWPSLAWRPPRLRRLAFCTGALVPLLLCFLILTSCGPRPIPSDPLTPTEPPVHLRIAAVPSGVAPLEACLLKYQERYPALSWEWIPQSGERALRALEEDRADLALVDRPIAQSPTATLMLRAPVLIVVHPSNRLADLSTSAIAALFGGQYEDWGQVGGDTGAVHLYVPPEYAGEARVLTAQALGGRPLASDALVCMTRESLLARVAQDPLGIGFTPGTATPAGVRTLRVDGCTPEQQCYPWWLGYWLVWKPDLEEVSLRAVRTALAGCPEAPGR
ncbi:MAG: substrate-binding domain-containing protein [Chloroflexia bacterium]